MLRISKSLKPDPSKINSQLTIVPNLIGKCQLSFELLQVKVSLGWLRLNSNLNNEAG